MAHVGALEFGGKIGVVDAIMIDAVDDVVLVEPSIEEFEAAQAAPAVGGDAPLGSGAAQVAGDLAIARDLGR